MSLSGHLSLPSEGCHIPGEHNKRFNLSLSAVQLTKVDVVKVATGYRASKVIGSSVVNEANDTVGKIDDIIIGQDGKSPFVVLSVGGFLGIGTKLIVLPYEQLKTTGGKIMLPGATKDALKDLPEFKYASS